MVRGVSENEWINLNPPDKSKQIANKRGEDEEERHSPGSPFFFCRFQS